MRCFSLKFITIRQNISAPIYFFENDFPAAIVPKEYDLIYIYM